MCVMKKFNERFFRTTSRRRLHLNATWHAGMGLGREGEGGGVKRDL